MQYQSSYYWQQEAPARTSLVVQQLMYRKRKIPIFFACICTGEGLESHNTYFAEQLTEWFCWKGREALLTAKQQEASKLESILRVKLTEMDKQFAEYFLHKKQGARAMPSCVGLLCVNNRFWMFYRGNVKIYLMNDRFGHAHCKCLTESNHADWTFLSGEMESNIGLLLATEDFGKKISKQQMEACLIVKEIVKRGKQRIKELGEAAERQGGKHMGAVLLVTH